MGALTARPPFGLSKREGYAVIGRRRTNVFFLAENGRFKAPSHKRDYLRPSGLIIMASSCPKSVFLKAADVAFL